MIDEQSISDEEEFASYEYEKMAALIQLLINKGVITKEELQQASSELAAVDEDSDEEEI